MTTGKPNNPTFLTENTPIGANVNRGFADTFNWLVRFCNNLQGDGYYINVENENGDQPVITWGETPPGEGGGGGEVTFSGTDGTSTAATNAFTFQSASDSNIVITCSGSTITAGAYYL